MAAMRLLWLLHQVVEVEGRTGNVVCLVGQQGNCKQNKNHLPGKAV
jgi:hypothetical protein